MNIQKLPCFPHLRLTSKCQSNLDAYFTSMVKHYILKLQTRKRQVTQYVLSFDYVLEVKKQYDNEYCNCTEKHGMGAWCQKWSKFIKKQFCVLSGGLNSKFCQGALPLAMHGKDLNDYFSSHPSVCGKSARKLLNNQFKPYLYFSNF